MQQKYMKRALSAYATIETIDAAISNLQQIGTMVVDSKADKIDLSLIVNGNSIEPGRERVKSNGFFSSLIQSDLEYFRETYGKMAANQELNGDASVYPRVAYDSRLSERSTLLIIDILITELKLRKEKLSSRIEKLMKA